jgi:hypothetical protein
LQENQGLKTRTKKIQGKQGLIHRKIQKGSRRTGPGKINDTK